MTQNPNKSIGAVWRGKIEPLNDQPVWFLSSNNGASLFRQSSEMGQCPIAFFSPFDAMSFAMTIPDKLAPDRAELKPYARDKSAVLKPGDPIIVMRRLIKICPKCGKPLSEPFAKMNGSSVSVTLRCADCGIDVSPFN